MQEEILTLTQALAVIPIGDDKLRRMAKAKEIPCRMVGGRYLFIRSDLVQFVRDGYKEDKCPIKEPALQSTGSLSQEYDRLLGRTTTTTRRRSKRG